MPSPLGERVRELRRKKGLTLEALAERVDSSKSYMWEIENKDVARPSGEKLHRIAQALDTTADYLLATDEVTEADAADVAFFRNYQKMKPKSKERLREMLKILDDEDE
ncbi:MAG: helix-turn-helix transcriptional regulator [Hyphomicrobiales bacterium]